jgi:two-component system, chemotaxis family, protein-glutamate methylesterase/glutaminase
VKATRVLIVDDSALFEEALREVFAGASDMEVVGAARSGEEAVELCQRLRPELVTMDVVMPGMGGLAAIEVIMAEQPTPILVVTSDPRGPSGDLAFEALRRGALDLMEKPARLPPSADERAALLQRVRLLAKVAVVRHPRGRRRAVHTAAEPAAGSVVGLVASTGGPAALAQVLGDLPPAFAPPVAVVQHIDATFAASFRAWLERATRRKVCFASEGVVLEPSTVALAPPGAHLVVDGERRAALVAEPRDVPHRPSGDMLLASLARSCGAQAVGVVLTGMGRDGAEGLLAIRRAGGATAAQDDHSSVVAGMPSAAERNGAAERRLALDAIAPWLTRLGPGGRR